MVDSPTARRVSPALKLNLYDLPTSPEETGQAIEGSYLPLVRDVVASVGPAGPGDHRWRPHGRGCAEGDDGRGERGAPLLPVASPPEVSSAIKLGTCTVGWIWNNGIAPHPKRREGNNPLGYTTKRTVRISFGRTETRRWEPSGRSGSHGVSIKSARQASRIERQRVKRTSKGCSEAL